MGRSERKNGGLVGHLIQGVGFTVGVATELRAHNKARKAAGQFIPARPQQVEPLDHNSDFNASYDEPPAYDDIGAMKMSTNSRVVPAESRSHFDNHTFNLQPLPLPVILPQRRPNDRSRGFLRAYAPDLGTYKGIDETTFHTFLKDFHKSSQASGIFTVINIAAFGAGFAPGMIATVTSMAVQAASTTAAQAQRRIRTNSYLDKANQELFHPKNLHCMILTFEPEASQHAVLDVNTESDATAQTLTSSTLTNRASRMDSSAFRDSDGVVQGELALPQAAHLVMPAQGQTHMPHANPDGSNNDNAQPGSHHQESAWKSTGKFLADYKDRRAQAKFAAQYGADSQLAVPGSMDPGRFASRWSDPNNRFYSGNPLGMLTGQDDSASSKDEKSRKHQKHHEHDERLEVTDSSDRERSRSRGGLLGGARSMMQQNLLYLLIAEIPSQEEMSALTRRM